MSDYFVGLANKGLGLKLWHLFRYKKLTEAVNQNDKLLIDLLNKVRVGNIDDGVGNLIQARFIHKSDKMPRTWMQRMNLLWKGVMLF